MLLRDGVLCWDCLLGMYLFMLVWYVGYLFVLAWFRIWVFVWVWLIDLFRVWFVWWVLLLDCDLAVGCFLGWWLFIACDALVRDFACIAGLGWLADWFGSYCELLDFVWYVVLAHLLFCCFVACWFG